MHFTNTAERSQVGYWTVKEIEKSSYLVLSVWERVNFSPSWYSASVKGRCFYCLHIGLRSQTALAFDLFFVGRAFDMPTDGKRSCSQRVGGKGNAGISEQGGITEHLLFQLVWARVSLHITAMVSDRSQLSCTTGNFPPVTLFNCACVNDLSCQNFRGKIHEIKLKHA